MAKNVRHLSRAPISEALIDVRAELPGDVDIEALHQLHAKIKDEYPEERVRRRWEQRLQVDAKTVETAPDASIDGYLFATEDQRQVVQFRLDGFAFSRLKPYESFDTLAQKTRPLWDLYARAAKPVRISRVALRFINELTMNLPAIPARYLEAPPTLPPDLALSMTDFFSRVQVTDVGTASTCLITQMLRGSGPGAATVVIDIDVFKEGEFHQDPESIWRTASVLRDVKNRVFFSLVTEEAITGWL